MLHNDIFISYMQINTNVSTVKLNLYADMTKIFTILHPRAIVHNVQNKSMF